MLRPWNQHCALILSHHLHVGNTLGSHSFFAMVRVIAMRLQKNTSWAIEISLAVWLADWFLPRRSIEAAFSQVRLVFELDILATLLYL